MRRCRRKLVTSATKRKPLRGMVRIRRLILAVVADGFARGVDPACQRGIGNGAATPDAAIRSSLLTTRSRFFDQKHQQVENLGFEGDRVTAAKKLPALRIKLMILKEKWHVCTPKGNPDIKTFLKK